MLRLHEDPQRRTHQHQIVDLVVRLEPQLVDHDIDAQPERTKILYAQGP
ncbi:hypothetical protein [Streptomyces sp. NRRL S-1813]|nr:hypothetical protein [Streptomyces sp. NRRL S-1813]